MRCNSILTAMASKLIYLLFPALARLVVASPSLGVAPLHVPDSDALVDNQYIVVLKDETPADAFNAHVNFVDFASQSSPLWGESGLNHVWDGGLLKGYSGRFSEDVLDMIRRRPEVDFVEQSQIVRVSEKQEPSPWVRLFFTNYLEVHRTYSIYSQGLHRISHRNKITPTESYEYVYTEGPGKGAMIYVIDTGIFIGHKDFGGRAKWGITIPKGSPDDDDHGHGTHVAGIAGGKQWGAAKEAQLTAVKVFNSTGTGSSDNILAGLVWADKDASSRALQAAAEIKATGSSSHKGSVINMSLTAPRSRALSTAASRAIGHGHHVIVAAGNFNKDACFYSPADVPETITVGATTIRDSRAIFSNRGNCVDLFAPGRDIVSCGIRSDTATTTMSGTSMASPYVAGVVAYLISIYPHATFNPKVSQNSLLDAYSAAFGVLPAFVSGMLPKPELFQQVEAATVAAPLTPAQLKKAVMDIATWGAIDDTMSPNNALLNNNATGPSGRAWFTETFWANV